MKKLLALALALALALSLAPAALGQSIGASQIRKHGHGGIVADTTNALAIGIYRSTMAPSVPVTGMLWCDTATTPCTLKSFNGTTWEASPDTTIAVVADLTSLPASPTDGKLVWVTSERRAIVYVEDDLRWYYFDGVAREAAASYNINTVTYPVDFLATAGATSGAAAATGSVTVGTHVCAVAYYNAIGGEGLPGATTPAVTVDGTQKINLTFGATVTGASGKRVYCSKANSNSPLYYIATIDDTTTTTYAFILADTSFPDITAPDVDFSASLPTGWVSKTRSRTYGGCGSTGLSILCYMLKVDDNASGSYGNRAFFDVTADPARWVASWRITRADNGFAGVSGSPSGYPQGGYTPLATISTSYTTNSPVMATVFSFANVAVPFTTTRTALLSAALRTTASTIFSSDYVPRESPFPPITSVPVYVRAVSVFESPNYAVQFHFSANARDWYQVPMTDVAADTTATACEVGFCSTTRLRYLGIGMENVGASPWGGSYVYEMKDFSWTSD